MNLLELIGRTEQVTFCGDDFSWWLPLAVTCGCFMFLHIISIIVIIHVLSKTLDPIQMLKMSRSCFPSKFLQPLWNEDEKDILDPISDFLEETSKRMNNNGKLRNVVYITK